MKVELVPKKPATLKVRYNGTDVFSKELEAGVKFAQDIETPKVTGVANVILVIDGVEVSVGSAAYTFDESDTEVPSHQVER